MNNHKLEKNLLSEAYEIKKQLAILRENELKDLKRLEKIGSKIDLLNKIFEN